MIVCEMGCGEDITETGIRIRDRYYCDLCGGELALEILGSRFSTEADRTCADVALAVIMRRREERIRTPRRIEEVP